MERMAALLAELPEAVAGCTVNRLCASGLEAINIAARMIETDHADVLIAGGVESMSRAPWVVAKSESAFSRDASIVDSTIGWRFTNPKMAALHQPYSMGQTAENVARRLRKRREEKKGKGRGKEEKGEEEEGREEEGGGERKKERGGEGGGGEEREGGGGGEGERPQSVE